MIELFMWPSINGHKASICCEAVGLEYEVRPVNIEAGEQFLPEFLEISPNNKVPAMVHTIGGKRIALFESGAILLYLSELTGKLRDGGDGPETVLQWLMFASTGVGPYCGQAYHFRHNAPVQLEYAIKRYTQEANRLATVLDRRLVASQFLGGPTFSIADIAAYPWMTRAEKLGIELALFPALDRWIREVSKIEAVKRGLAVLDAAKRTGPMSKEIWEIYYGETQRRQGVQ